MQVLEHVAGYLGLDATLVRERNFMYPKDLPAHPYATPTLKPNAATPTPATAAAKPDDQNCNGKADFLGAHSQAKTSSLDGKGEEQRKNAAGKSQATPDVVCGRFQMKEHGDDASEVSAMSAGRYVFPLTRQGRM